MLTKDCNYIIKETYISGERNAKKPVSFELSQESTQVYLERKADALQFRSALGMVREVGLRKFAEFSQFSDSESDDDVVKRKQSTSIQNRIFIQHSHRSLIPKCVSNRI